MHVKTLNYDIVNYYHQLETIAAALARMMTIDFGNVEFFYNETLNAPS